MRAVAYTTAAAHGIAWEVEQERAALLLLARNQHTRAQIEEAGRHVERLGRLLKSLARGEGREARGQAGPHASRLSPLAYGMAAGVPEVRTPAAPARST